MKRAPQIAIPNMRSAEPKMILRMRSSAQPKTFLDLPSSEPQRPGPRGA